MLPWSQAWHPQCQHLFVFPFWLNSICPPLKVGSQDALIHGSQDALIHAWDDPLPYVFQLGKPMLLTTQLKCTLRVPPKWHAAFKRVDRTSGTAAAKTHPRRYLTCNQSLSMLITRTFMKSTCKHCSMALQETSKCSLGRVSGSFVILFLNTQTYKSDILLRKICALKTHTNPRSRFAHISQFLNQLD